MINQEFKAQGTKYQVLPHFVICCRELGLKVTRFFECARSFCADIHTASLDLATKKCCPKTFLAKFIQTVNVLRTMVATSG